MLKKDQKYFSSSEDTGCEVDKVDKSLTWDLTKMYSDDDAYEKDKEDLISNIEKLENITKDSDHLLEIMKLSEEISRKASHMFAFAKMSRDEDSTIASSQRRLMEMESIYARASSAGAFIDPLILGLSKDEIEEITTDDKYERYHKEFSKILRLKEYTLSDDEERILSLMDPAIGTAQSTYFMLQNADMKYGKIPGTDEELTDTNYVNFLTRPDRELREKAFNLMFDTQSDYENTVGTMLHSNIRDKTQLAKIKGYDSLRHMELYGDDVPESLYDDLLQVIHEFLPDYQKFYDLRSEILGLDEAHMYDVYATVTEDSKEYTYEEAKEIILDALSPLGEEYVSIVKRAFDERWIDVYPRSGKSGGAYSYGTYDSVPFIMMNYTNDLNSLFTLAHELGHSIHSYYSRKNNNFLESGYTIFVAEVASTFNENIIIQYMLDRAETPEEKLVIINHHLESFKGTVFRQSMFAEFEKLTHERIGAGEGLTGSDFSEIYYDLNKKYFGDSVVSDENIGYEWMRIPHFYRNFYVYKYATGFLASTVLSNKVLQGGEEELEDYKDFLKDGSQNFPLDQLKAAGCDLTDPQVLRSGFEIFSQRVKELEELVKSK